MKKFYLLVICLCISQGSLRGMQHLPVGAALDFARYEGLLAALAAHADSAVGHTVSLAAKGVKGCFQFCRTYPRLVLFIIFVIPLLSPRWRSFLFNTVGGAIASLGRRIWALIDARLFGWMHQGIANVESSLSEQRQELVGQSRKMGLLKTEIESVNDELQEQIKNLEKLLISHAEQLEQLKEQDHEIVLKLDKTNSLETEQSLRLSDIQAQSAIIGQRIDSISLSVDGLDQKLLHGNKDLLEKIESLDSLRQAFSTFEQRVASQHQDLVAAMERRFESLPESQRKILNEYSLQIASRFDQLSADIDKILRVASTQNMPLQNPQSHGTLHNKKISVRT